MTVSLILPCYNEELNLQKGVLDKVGNYTKDDPKFQEVIIVDDGSSDRSKEIVKSEYLKAFPKFKLVENRHHGKAYAVVTGIKKARGEFVAFSDFDLATPIEEMEKLIGKAEQGSGIVIGSRNVTRKGAPILRRMMALGFIIIRNLSIGLKGIRDTQCGFKMFRKDLALRILEKLQVYKKSKEVKGSSVSAGFDLEFLFLASKMGERIAEVPVIWRHVETKNVHFIHDSLETLKDIMMIKKLDLQGKYSKK